VRRSPFFRVAINAPFIEGTLRIFNASDSTVAVVDLGVSTVAGATLSITVAGGFGNICKYVSLLRFHISQTILIR
jgi:hypothetical protein